MNKKELKKAFEENLISKEQYKEKLFELENTPKMPRKPKKMPVAVSYDEFRAILKETRQKKYKIAFILGWMSGLRISEVVNAKPPTSEELKYGNMMILGKGNKEAPAPIPKNINKEYFNLMPIKKHFKNEKSAIRSIQIAFKRAAKRAGVTKDKPTVHFHSLRHGFGTHGANQGIPIHTLRTLMRHANIATTNIYLEVNPKRAIQDYQELF